MLSVPSHPRAPWPASPDAVGRDLSGATAAISTIRAERREMVGSGCSNRIDHGDTG
jgi:hypothetical protein